jgi:hypothetical protein
MEMVWRPCGGHVEARLVHDPLLALAGEIFEVAWEATG